MLRREERTHWGVIFSLNRKYGGMMRKSLLLVLGLLLMVGSQLVSAQQDYGFCTVMVTAGSVTTCYTTDLFRFGATYNQQQLDQLYWNYFDANYRPRLQGDWFAANGPYCWGGYASATAVKRLSPSCNRVVRTGWTHPAKVEGTAAANSSGDQKTEAAALYDAEQHAQQAIPAQPDKTFWVKSWDDHSCEPHSRKTSQYAGAATVTTYSCTVKFTYSEDRNPQAFATLGEGATQDAAVQAAQLNHAGVTWDEPFCSQTRKRAAYGSASYKVGQSGSSTPWYVCTIGYRANQ
jgi:hypothetical protein